MSPWGLLDPSQDLMQGLDPKVVLPLAQRIAPLLAAAHSGGGKANPLLSLLQGGGPAPAGVRGPDMPDGSFITKQGMPAPASPDPALDATQPVQGMAPVQAPQARAAPAFASRVAQGSGLKNAEINKAVQEAKASQSNTVSSEQGQKTTTGTTQQDTNSQEDIAKRMAAVDPTTSAAMYQNFMNSAPAQEQLSGINRIQQLLTGSIKNPDYFTAPLAGLLESEFHRPVDAFLKGQGETAQAQNARLVQGLDTLQTARAALSKDAIAGIAAQKGGFNLTKDQAASLFKATAGQENTANQKQAQTNTQSQAATNSQTQEASAADPNSMIRGFVNPVTAANEYNNYVSKTMSESDKQAEAISEVIDKVGLGNADVDRLIPAIMVRGEVGAGRINVQEMKMAGVSAAVTERIKNALSLASSGKISDSNRMEILRGFRDLARYQQQQDRTPLANKVTAQGVQYNQGPKSTSLTLDPAYVNRLGRAAENADGLLKNLEDNQRSAPRGIGTQIMDALTGSGPPAATQTPATNGPPPGLSFEQFQAWRRANGQ